MNKKISTKTGVLIIFFAALMVILVLTFLSQKNREEILLGKEAYNKNINVEIFKANKEKSFLKDVINCNEDFDFIYSFGVGKSTINTKNNTYSPDMCGEPASDHNMIFTKEEKTEICRYIKKNNLISIKDEFTNNCNEDGELCVNVIPLTSKVLKIFSEGKKIKKISYLSHYYNQDDPQLEIFKKTTKAIEDIVSRKVEELNIYQPMCGYM